jgi:DNA-binding Lrp family transcriptional regulator
VPRNVSTTNVLKRLSDYKTERIFKTISTNDDLTSETLMAKLGLSKRQYYDRIRNLVEAGLIRRHKGKYKISSFGKVVLNLQRVAERTSHIHWKLEAIDNIKMSDKSIIAEIDYLKIIDILLDDIEIKDMYLRNNHHLTGEIETR